MSESKMKDEEDFLRNLPTVEVTNVEISPNPTHISNELNLEVDFHIDQDISDAYWEVKYLVDSVEQRHIIHLGKTKTESYSKGDNNFQFTVDQVNVSGIKKSNLTNCGLLSATLCSGHGEIMDLKMVVQVSKQDGEYFRRIFNPLE